MPNCKELPVDVRNYIRSGFVINTFCDHVQELVYNSIDSGATKISIDVNFVLPRIEVSDNGEGISKSDLETIGKRYYTSKCSSKGDLDDLKYYGCRGEALASMIEYSSAVEFITRSSGSKHPLKKTCGLTSVIEKLSSDQMPSHGTKVIIHHPLLKSSVHLEKVKKEIEIEKKNIESMLSRISLVNHKVQFILRTSPDQIALQINPSDSLQSSFKEFLNFKQCDLREFSHRFSFFFFEAVISIDYSASSRDGQLVYINKRPIGRGKIHRLIENQLSDPNLLSGSGKGIKKQQSTSFNTRGDKHPVFCLNIECAYKEYHIIDAKKGQVKWKNEDALTEAIKGMVSKYIHLLENSDGKRGLKRSQSWDEKQSGKRERKNSFSKLNVNSIPGAVSSKVVTRKVQPTATITKAPSTPDSDDEDEDDKMGEEPHRNFRRLGYRDANGSSPNSAQHNTSSNSSDHDQMSQQTSQPTVPRIKSKINQSPQKPVKLPQTKRKMHTLKGIGRKFSNQNIVVSKSNLPTSLNTKGLHEKMTKYPVGQESRLPFPSRKRRLGSDSPDAGTLSEGIANISVSTSKRSRSRALDSTTNSTPETPGSHTYGISSSIYSSTTDEYAGRAPYRDIINEVCQSLVSPGSIEREIEARKMTLSAQIAANGVKPPSPLSSIPQQGPPQSTPRYKLDLRSIVSKAAAKSSNGCNLLQLSSEGARGSELTIPSLNDSATGQRREHRFTKEDLKNCNILKQLDNKFIVAIMKSKDSNTRTLVLFDQHAVDERIQVEKLTREAKDPGNPNRFAPCDIRQPFEISLDKNHIDFMTNVNFSGHFERVGLRFFPTGPPGHRVRFYCLPKPAIEKLNLFPQKEGGISWAASWTYSLLKEVCGGIHKNITEGTPRVIHELLASQACHSAIRFGKVLKRDERLDLIQRLQKCDYPFMCAHGRPSVYPIVDLDDNLEKLFKNEWLERSRRQTNGLDNGEPIISSPYWGEKPSENSLELFQQPLSTGFNILQSRDTDSQDQSSTMEMGSQPQLGDMGLNLFQEPYGTFQNPPQPPPVPSIPEQVNQEPINLFEDTTPSRTVPVPESPFLNFQNDIIFK